MARVGLKVSENSIKSYTLPPMKKFITLQSKHAAIRSVVERHNALNT
jgi:hypothetical protein